MPIEQVIIATVAWLIIVSIVYSHSNWDKIKDCYSLWLTKSYWTNYNTIEAISWIAKIIIIVPGLIFGIEIWWLFYITLITSVMLIWASNKKLLPTLVAFNTVWIWISCMVLIQHLL